MNHITSLKCLICGKEYQPDEIDYVCPDHGYEGIVDVQYDYGLISLSFRPQNLADDRDYSIWRYKPLLPIEPDSPVPPLAVGWTPLYEAPRLAAPLGLKHLWVKDDGRQATASFKDRASAIAVVKAQEKGAAIITTASTGNAAAALSGICASVQQPNVIFVPETAPPAKIAQLLTFGSTVMLVHGTYDDAFDLCLQAAETYGWYNRNTGFNPYMSEGKKTVSFEICEQLSLTPGPSPAGRGGMWQAPDAIFVSVGDGCIIGGVHKGLRDLLELGWIDHMPRIYGVQAAGSNFMAEAWQAGLYGLRVLEKPPIDAHTVADSISAGLPRDRIKAMAAVVDTGGAYVTVTDDEILAAIPVLARGCGVFAEPAGATSYAGLVKAVEQGLVSPDDRIVVINTGSGLKDVKSAMTAVEQAGTRPYRVEPNLADLQRVMAEIGR
ncbi:MAG: threonine synthase [Caldilineae bacterium]|nr:threonine synthase [Caldilineae bacterium]